MDTAPKQPSIEDLQWQVKRYKDFLKELANSIYTVAYGEQLPYPKDQLEMAFNHGVHKAASRAKWYLLDHKDLIADVTLDNNDKNG